MKYFFVSVLLLIPCIVNAQQGQPTIDSLLKELQHAKEDTNKVKILDRFSFIYSAINPDEGIKYGNEALKLAERLGWKTGMALANADIGVNYEAKSNHLLSLDFLSKALKLYEGIKDKSGMAAVMANTGLIYLNQSSYFKTLEYSFNALKIYEELGDNRNRAVILETIGSAYFEQKNYTKAIEYYSDALKINKELGNKEGIARNLGNVGIVFDVNGNYDSALEHHKMALKINEEIGNKNAAQINLANIGYVYSHRHDYSKALEFQLMALKISEDAKIKNSIAVNLGNIGETYFAIATDTTKSIELKTISGDKTANLNKAIQYLEKAASLCNKINYTAPQLEYTQYLLDAYALWGNYKQAFLASKQCAILKDTIFSNQNKLQIANLEAQREIEISNRDLLIKDKQIQIKKLELAQKRDERILYLISIVLLVVVIGIVLKYLYAFKISNNRLQIEKKKHLSLIEEQILRIKNQNKILSEIAHMQSHDVRGPVATILGLVQVFNFDDLADPANKVVIEGIAQITQKLDTAVKEIVKKENSLKD